VSDNTNENASATPQGPQPDEDISRLDFEINATDKKLLEIADYGDEAMRMVYQFPLTQAGRNHVRILGALDEVPDAAVEYVYALDERSLVAQLTGSGAELARVLVRMCEPSDLKS